MRPHHILFFICALLFSTSSFAGTVVKSKGKKIYIVFDKSEGGTFAKDDLFNITDAKGKRIGIVELKKVKGLKAVGVLRKGKAAKGNGTLFRSISKKGKKMKTLGDAEKSSDSLGSTDDNFSYKPETTRFGLQFGYSTASQEVVIKDASGTYVSDQSGTSMSFKGIMDMPLLTTVSLYMGLGLDSFEVTEGTPAIPGGEAMSTEIKYFSGDALLKWTAYKSGGFRGYLLGGGGLLHPMSKSSDAIDPGTITTLFVGEFGAGVEFTVLGYALPVDFIYYYFPSSDAVKTSIMAFRIGFYF